MADDAGNPNQQLAAAWQAATAALGEWRQQVSAATSDAMNKIDPAIRAAVEAGRSALSGEGRAWLWQCGPAHPDDKGVCECRAVLTRTVRQAALRMCASRV